MRSLLFKAIVLLMFIMPLTAHAEVETFGQDITLSGETTYNNAAQGLMDGSFSLSGAGIINAVTDDILGEIRECGTDLAILIIIAAISGVISTVSKSFEKKGSGEAAFFACFTLMSAAAIKCFYTALTYCTEVTGALTDFITKLSPLFMLMIASSGKAVSAAAFEPVMSGAVYVMSLVIEKCLIPLAAYSAVLAVAGNMSSDLPLSNFCKLVKSVAKWIMAAVITIFTGVSAVYGFSSPSLDAVGGKAVKFAVGSLVPVVGTFLSDTLETVVSGTQLMKNSVGTAGIITVCAISLMPILKIGVLQLMLKITSAIAEPLTDKRISGMLWEVSESVTTLFAVVVMATVMFIINLSIMMAVTNGV